MGLRTDLTLPNTSTLDFAERFWREGAGWLVDDTQAGETAGFAASGVLKG